MVNIIAFMAWVAIGIAFIGAAVYALFSDKPMGFWANAPVFEVSDVKKYNRAVAKVLAVFGAVFSVFGIPLLPGINTLWILLAIPGVAALGIGSMVVYSLVIEKKYRK